MASKLTSDQATTCVRAILDHAVPGCYSQPFEIMLAWCTDDGHQ